MGVKAKGLRQACAAALTVLAVLLACAGLLAGGRQAAYAAGEDDFSGGELGVAPLEAQASIESYALLEQSGTSYYLYPCDAFGTKTSDYWVYGTSPSSSISSAESAVQERLNYITTLIVDAEITKVPERAKCPYQVIILNSMKVRNYTAVSYEPNIHALLPNLEEVVFPVGSELREIGSGAFKNCVNLWNLDGFDSLVHLKTIGSSAFEGCERLSSVAFPVGGELTQIGGSAFKNCTTLWNLEGFGLLADLKTIGSSAFYGCKDLPSVVLPASVTQLYSSAFAGCLNLRSIVLDDSLDKIGENAFSGCKQLQRLTMPASVTQIGWHAFEYCASLEEIEFKGKNPPSVSSAFTNVPNNLEIIVPAGALAAYKNANGFRSVQHIRDVDGNTKVPVVKKSNTVKVTAYAVNVSHSQLKKSTRSFTYRPFWVSYAQGKVTFAKKSGNKRIKVSKNGTVTVKKGLKKGTYAVRVKVRAAGNSEYKPKTVTSRLKVRVR